MIIPFCATEFCGTYGDSHLLYCGIHGDNHLTYPCFYIAKSVETRLLWPQKGKKQDNLKKNDKNDTSNEIKYVHLQPDGLSEVKQKKGMAPFQCHIQQKDHIKLAKHALGGDA
jgi:hypothetical protein